MSRTRPYPYSLGQKIITDYYKPSSKPILKCKGEDKCAQIYLDKSIRESK
jgi:hypothetical protein